MTSSAWGFLESGIPRKAVGALYKLQDNQAIHESKLRYTGKARNGVKAIKIPSRFVSKRLKLRDTTKTASCDMMKSAKSTDQGA